MVLAEGEDLDISHNDELIVVLVEDSTVDDVAQVLFIALGEEEQGLSIALGCVQQSLAVWIFAQTLKHRSDSTRQLLQIGFLLLLGRLLPLPRALAGPAKPIEVDGGMLCVWAMGATSRKWCLGNGALVRVFGVYLAVRHDMSVVSVHVRDRSLRGEIASRPVKVYWLAPSVGSLYSIEEVLALFPVARLGGEPEG